MNKLDWLIPYLVGLPRVARKAIVVLFDVLVCVAAAFLAFWLRLGEWWGFRPVLIFCAIAVPVWLLVAYFTRQYRFIVRFSGRETVLSLIGAAPLMMAVMAVLLLTLEIQGIPRTLAVLHPLIFVMALAWARIMIAQVLTAGLQDGAGRGDRKRVLIYGAGPAGQQLAASMRHAPGLAVVGFVDASVALRNQFLEGNPIWHTGDLKAVLVRERVDEVFLALSSAPRSERRKVVEQLRQTAPLITVRTLPSVSEMAFDEVSINDLREVQVEELLGRDEVVSDPKLMSVDIAGKRAMVTGAGGSIGSELSRQILRQRPAVLILADQSEHALYLIDAELREINHREALAVEIVPELVDVADENDCRRAFRRWPADSVFHAAAYKHVPLIEANPIPGIRNNVLGTLNCCLAAEAAGVAKFILVSTDKAVRPTNLMGASKRVCELIIQARSRAQANTTYTAVRFGNVLGSSGSVVPRFREQIARGGPVTITHADVTRYFMTIPEASQLVIQAGAMAEGGEIFLLDMGNPVRIVDLARSMIELMGLTVADDDHPEGDIALVEVGLRPGEKLIEELLIDQHSEPTPHPRIVKAHESMIEWDDLQLWLNELSACIHAANVDSAVEILRGVVAGFTRDGDVVTSRSKSIARSKLASVK